MNAHDHVFDTIAAIATPPGRGGIAIVKLSGPNAIAITSGIVEPPADPASHDRTAVFCHIVDADIRIGDALVIVMRGPRSYTGEDVAEIQLHGGTASAQAVLALVIAHGARQALPGEFTRRAFLNGKLDLAQAEGVAQIAAAGNILHLKEAERLLTGAFSGHITALTGTLSGALMHLEAAIDFPGDTSAEPDIAAISALLDQSTATLDTMLESQRTADRIRHGITVVLAGPVNAGKSSLFNALLGRTRSIVDPSPGTTRDWIEAIIEIDGLPVNLIDTAGIRESGDTIERVGIAESTRLIEQADIVLALTESATPGDTSDIPGSNCILIEVASKADLAGTPPADGRIAISSLTGEGIARLRNMIADHARALFHTGAVDTLVLVDRHRRELTEARAAIIRACEFLGAGSEELIAFELRESIRHLEAILGKAIDIDILDRVFSQFCIGK